MKILITLMVTLMTTIQGFTKVENWERFNSSLLIEVTRPNGVFTCTGVAVSDKLLVTAAHCLEGNISRVRVFTQAAYNPKQSSLEVTDYKVHPNYNPSKSRFKSDIAKITMKEKLPSFIKLYPIYQGTKVSGNIFRFGFGARNKKNLRTVITPTLRKLDLNEEILELNDKFSMSGDSGGPIYMQSGNDISILAIHSTLSHGPEGSFSLNPLLSAYVPWILSN
jgi:hypothetical protein